MYPGVTAVVPTIPPRSGARKPGTFPRALKSVLRQTYPVSGISVAIDHDRKGSTATRNRAFAAVDTEWTALLDDDDEWKPEHIELMMIHARATGADLVYPWFDVATPKGPGVDPWPGAEGSPFDPVRLERENYIPITVLVRTGLLRSVGGFRAKGPASNPCDDHGTWEALLGAGAIFSHLPHRTWTWHWHRGNTNGRGDLW